MPAHIVNIANEVGAFGTTYVNDTAAHTPTSPNTSWFRFVPTADSVIATATAGGVDGNTLATITANVGCWVDIPGCTSFTLTSGAGFLYYSLA